MHPFFPIIFHRIVALMLSTLYLSLLYGLNVPSWEYQIPIESSLSPPKTFSVSFNLFFLTLLSLVKCSTV